MKNFSFLIKNRRAQNDQRENGYILMSLLFIGAVIFCMAMSTILVMQQSLKSAGKQRTHASAFNIAEAGKEHVLAMLRNNPNMLDSFGASYQYVLKDFTFSTGKYSVQCKTNTTKDTLTLNSLGRSDSQACTIEAAYIRFSAWNNMKAVVNSRYAVQLLGNIVIDGRDWDSTNSTIIGNGVLGIYTFDTVDAGASSSIGGPALEPPTPKGTAAGSIQTFQDTASLASTPEAVLGLNPGDLNAYKAPPPGGTFYTGNNNIVFWDSCTLATISLSGDGIIICHNANYTGTLTNVHGAFRGIIIADKINKVNANTQFLGVIFTLSKTGSSNIFGNGTPKLRYSSQIIKKMLQGHSPTTIRQISWKEL